MSDIKKTTIVSSFSWAYIDKITTQGLSAFVSIILARLIDPAHYGIIAIAFIFVGILDIFITPGLCSALVQKKNPDEVDYSSMFFFNMLLSIVLYIIIFLVAPFIESFFNVNGLTMIIRVMSIRLPFASMNSVQMAYVQKNLLYNKYFFVSFFGTAVASIIAISMAYMGMGVWALVVNYLMNGIIDTFLALIFISWRPTTNISLERFRSMFTFGKRVLAVKIVDTLYSDISGFIIGKKYNPSDLAYYNKGKMFPQLIIQNISASITDVLFPVLSNVQDNRDQMIIIMRKTLRTSVYVIYPILIGLFVCGDNFIRLVLTDKWLSCVPFMRVMCIYSLCIPSSSIILQGIKAIGRSDILLKIELIKKTYSIAIIVFFLLIFDTPIAVAYGFMSSAIISLFVNMYACNRFFGYKMYEQLKDVSPIVVVTTIMGITTYLIGFINVHYVLQLCIQVVAGVLVYVAFSFLLNLSEFFYILSTIKRKVKRSKNNYI